MIYETVFDINQKTFPWNFVAVFLLLLIIGALLYISDGKWRFKSPVSLGFCAIGLMGVVIGSALYIKLESNKEALNKGNYLVVEGTVTDFKPMPPQRHSYESFRVNGVLFEYADRVITPGFNQTVLVGGPIRNGETVRVYYLDHYILKLEIRRK